MKHTDGSVRHPGLDNHGSGSYQTDSVKVTRRLTVVEREPRLVYYPQTSAVCQSNGTITGGTDFHGHEQRRPELDRQLYLGHR